MAAFCMDRGGRESNNAMTTQTLEKLIRRALAGIEMGGYTLSSIHVNDVPGLLCFIVSFSYRRRNPAYLYLDLHEQDEERTMHEIFHQLMEHQTARTVCFD
jgi:hypothetical protein